MSRALSNARYGKSFSWPQKLGVYGAHAGTYDAETPDGVDRNIPIEGRLERDFCLIFFTIPQDCIGGSGYDRQAGIHLQALLLMALSAWCLGVSRSFLR